MRSVVFVTGPLGVGKTTIIQEALLQCREFSYFRNFHPSTSVTPTSIVVELEVAHFIGQIPLRDGIQTVLVSPPDDHPAEKVLTDRLRERERHIFPKARLHPGQAQDRISRDCDLVREIWAHNFDLRLKGVYLRPLVTEFVQFLNKVAQVTREGHVDV